MIDLQIIRADLNDEGQQSDFITVLNSYAIDIMGGGEPLKKEVIDSLIPELRGIDNKLILMAYLSNEPVGIANCFYGFSTFKARKLINIHDFAVVPRVRGKGVGRAMARLAKNEGCCKLTLEVLEGNKTAISLYESEGFSGYELDPKMGKAIFLDKLL